MRRHGGAARLAVAMLLALSAVPALASRVYYRNGRLERALVGDPLPGLDYSLPCGYDAGHEAVLGPIVQAVTAEAAPHTIWRLGDPNISCFDSATAMLNVIRQNDVPGSPGRPLLPDGWQARRVNSNWDVGTAFGSTSHVAYVIEAPDGTAYLMDSYFFGAEIMKMYKRGDGLYRPAEDNHVFASKAYVQIMGNAWNEWILADTDYDPAMDRSRRMQKRLGKLATRVSSSHDPNDIYGPAGIGDARHINGQAELPYTIAFENLATAGLAAVDVRVEARLDPLTMDLGTLRLGEIRFGRRVIALPDGGQEHETTVDLRPDENLLVRIAASLDPESGTLRWVFNTLDPATMAAPEDFEAGFLPPNAASPEGEGTVSFSVRPQPGLLTGTVIEASSDIWFDVNPPIATPVWTNTVDVTAPVSTIVSPAMFSQRRRLTFGVSGDDAHSGVARYDVFGSVDGSPFVLAAVGLAGDELQFDAERGRTYSFYCVTEDAVGNRESAPSAAQVTVTIGPLGDVSGDLAASVRDVVLVAREQVAGPTGIDCDVNEDGTVDALDTRLGIDAALGRPLG